MRKFALLLGSCWLLLGLTAQAKTLSVATAEWKGYTELDGSGIYMTLLHEVFTEYKLQYHIDDFNRTLDSFGKGEADIVVGVFRDDIGKATFPNWFLDTEFPVTAYSLTDREAIVRDSDLENLTVSWVRGYNFERFLPDVQRIYPVGHPKEGFKLLEKKRVDAFVDFDYNVPGDLRERLNSYVVASSRHIYLAFQDNEQGRTLAAVFDRKMAALRDSGRLAEIFAESYASTGLAEFVPNRQKVVIAAQEIRHIDSHELGIQQMGKSGSAVSDVLSLLLPQLHQFNFDFKVLKHYDEAAMASQSADVCFSNMLKTLSREQHYLFSEPMTVFTGVRLYSLQPLDLPEPIDLLAALKLSSKYRIGLSQGQSYTPTIDRVISNIPAQQIVDVPVDTLISLRKFAAGQFDFRLGYPSVVDDLWSKVSTKPVYSYAIKDTPEFIYGYLICPKNQANQAFITAFNQVLARSYGTELYQQAHSQNTNQRHRETLLRHIQQLAAEHASGR